MKATKHQTIVAMLRALKFKDMETAQDALNHGGFSGQGKPAAPMDFHDMIGCGCCSSGPFGVWYESWNADTEQGRKLRGKKDITTYRYLADDEYLLRLNPLFIDRIIEAKGFA